MASIRRIYSREGSNQRALDVSLVIMSYRSENSFNELEKARV